jgi:hypothetical protein
MIFVRTPVLGDLKSGKLELVFDGKESNASLTDTGLYLCPDKPSKQDVFHQEKLRCLWSNRSSDLVDRAEMTSFLGGYPHRHYY